MVRVVQVDALVVQVGAVVVHRVGAMEHDVARVRLRLDARRAARQPRALSICRSRSSPRRNRAA